MRPLPGRVGDFAIRAAGVGDAPAIAGIYNPYVVETTITFEETIVSAAEMATRIAEVTDSKLPFLVADAGGQAIGFAYASKWKGRCAYRHTAETTVYVDRDHWHRGVGTELYGGLLGLLQGAGFHAAIGGIALPNDSSIALHERLGFVKAAHFREVGFKFNRWIDVGYWQLMFAGGFPGPVGQVPSSGQ